MLFKILDETMAKAAKYENLTCESLFGHRSFDSGKIQSPEKEFINIQQKFHDIESDMSEKSTVDESEIAEYIVEEEPQKVNFLDFSDSPKTGLPFFKSLSYKLAENFGGNL